MTLCRNGCPTNLHFEDSVKSRSGKLIPLEDDGSPHDCPNRRTYDPGIVNRIENKIEKMDKNLLKMMLEVHLIWMKLEGQKTLDET